MTPKERELLQKLDDLVLGASPEQLAKIQSADLESQMEGASLYEVYLDSRSLVHQSTKAQRRGHS